MKRRRKHTTSVVLVLAACALATYAWIDRGSVSVGERSKRERNVFVAWRREDLTRIELEHDKEKLVLVRANDDAGDSGWRMASPRDGEVDAALVDRFLGTLEFATIVRKVGTEEIPGFDAPRARGTIAMGAVTYAFVLGPEAKTPEGAAYFRMTGGEGTVVVSKELATDLMKGADAFRTRTLVPYLSLDLARLEVTGRASAFVLERKDNERSFTLRDRGLRASRERLDRVWGAFAQMRAEAFVTDADAEKAVAEPQVRVTMIPKNGRPKGELVIGGPCPGHPNDVVAIRRAPDKAAACVPKDVVDGLSVTQGWLVDTRLFSLHEDEIEEARLEASPTGAILDIARKGSGFRELAPESRDLSAEEAETATGLVRALARAEGEVLGRDESDALKSGLRGRVTLTHAEAGEEEQVEIAWDGAEGSVFVRRRADGAILRVSAKVARELSPRVTSVRPRALWPETLSGKPVVSVDTRCGGVVQRVTRDGAGFKLDVDGAQVAPDAALLLDAIDALSRARAESWVADTDDGTFGFGPTSCSFHATFADEAGVRSEGIWFGAATDAGTYAKLDGDAAVFLAPRGLAVALTASLLDRHSLVIDPYSVVAIDVTARGARRTLDPHGRDPKGQLLGDDLAGLLTETAHMGPARKGEGLDAPVSVVVRLLADAGRRDVRFAVGAETERGGRKMRFVRVSGLDATLLAPSGDDEPLGRILGAR